MTKISKKKIVTVSKVTMLSWGLMSACRKTEDQQTNKQVKMMMAIWLKDFKVALDMWKPTRCLLMGNHCPATLLKTLVYLFGLHFALHGRDEHHQLHHYPSQISTKVSDNGRQYLEYKLVSGLFNFVVVIQEYFCSCCMQACVVFFEQWGSTKVAGHVCQSS